MIDIQKIAELAHKAAPDMTWYAAVDDPSQAAPEELAFLTRFANLIREAVVQELVAGSGEPVENLLVKISHNKTEPGQDYYTADQLAGGILRERERCAKVCDPYTHGQWFAAAIRSGDVPHT